MRSGSSTTKTSKAAVSRPEPVAQLEYAPDNSRQGSSVASPTSQSRGSSNQSTPKPDKPTVWPRIRGFTARAAVTGAAGAVFLAPAADAKPAMCDTPFDPYKTSQEKRDACGLETHSLSQKRTFADGSREYHYSLRGKDISIPVPPPGFNAVSATPAQRARYGIPPLQTDADPATRAQYADYLRKVHFVPPPDFLVGSPDVRLYPTYNTEHFAGWTTHEYPQNFFTQMYAEWTEPSDQGTACLNHSLGLWAGIQGHNGQLLQNGTVYSIPGVANHQGFWEDIPSYSNFGAGAQFIPFYATAGQSFKARTDYNPSTHVASFVWSDYTGAQFGPLRVASNSYDGHIAEFIVERPWVGGHFRDLTNFTLLQVGQAKAQGATRGDIKFNMSSFAGAMANTGEQDQNGGFPVYWKNCAGTA
jgi:hypothetical protein